MLVPELSFISCIVPFISFLKYALLDDWGYETAQ